MKSKFIRALFLWMIIALPALNAQEIKYGVQAGFDLSSIFMIYKTTDGASIETDVRYLPTFNANIYVGFPLDDNYTLSFEPGFIRKGMKFGNYAIPFSYLQVPIGFNYGVNDKFSLTAGPEISYLLSSEINKVFLKQFDLAVFAGASYDFTDNIEAGARYSNSLNGVWRNKEVEIIDVNGILVTEMDYLHHYFQLFVRCKF